MDKLVALLPTILAVNGAGDAFAATGESSNAH